MDCRTTSEGETVSTDEFRITGLTRTIFFSASDQSGMYSPQGG
jgi:hypothetical protein